MIACAAHLASYGRCMISEWQFGTRANGQAVKAYKLRSTTGCQAVILNYGAILQSLCLPDGRNIALGFETWDGYKADKNYIGRIIGPNANRIAGAQFQIDETSHSLAANEGVDNLHSGPNGFDSQMWDVSYGSQSLNLKHRSPHGFNGFPGKVEAALKISLTCNSLRLEMQAVSDRPTPLNLTWHTYWNLSNDKRIDGHNLQIQSNSITNLVTDTETQIPQTRYDFRSPLPLGSVKLDSNYKDVKSAKLNSRNIGLTVTSSLPDMQVYTGDGLPTPRQAIAIEPQFRPNDINFAQDSLLRPNEIYKHWIEYQFDMG